MDDDDAGGVPHHHVGDPDAGNWDDDDLEGDDDLEEDDDVGDPDDGNLGDDDMEDGDDAGDPNMGNLDDDDDVGDPNPLDDDDDDVEEQDEGDMDEDDDLEDQDEGDMGNDDLGDPEGDVDDTEGVPHVPAKLSPLLLPISDTEPEYDSDGYPPEQQSPNPVELPMIVINFPHQFREPVACISLWEHIPSLHVWPSMRMFLGFVGSLNDSVRGRRMNRVYTASVTIKNIIGILNQVSSMIDNEMPPLETQVQVDSAYSSFHNLLQQSHNLMGTVLVGNLQASLVEVFPYFASSFGSVGSRTFGVYHETNFVAWLYCLARMDLIAPEDYPAIVAKVFIRYRETIAKLKTIFYSFRAVSINVLKPSHDEFLPYLFGSSELIEEDPNGPAIIRSCDAVIVRQNKYLFFQLVMETISRDPFKLSGTLLDMSRMEYWSSVNQFLLKLYQDQFKVLAALKKFRFGSLIEWREPGIDEDP